MKRFASILLVVIFYSFNSVAGVNYYYVVKKDDNISKILYLAGMKPIYGKRGKLKIVQNLNSKNIPSVEKIYPNQKIYFPEELVLHAKLLGFVSVINDAEVVFNSTGESFIKSSIRSAASENQSLQPTLAPNSSAVDTIDIEQSRLSIYTYSGYSRVDSQYLSSNASAVLLSKPMMGTRLSWQQVWSHKIETSLLWDYQAIEYEDADLGTIYNSRPTMIKMGLGIQYNFANSFGVDFEFGSKGNALVTSAQQGTASVEVKDLFYTQLGLNKNILRSRGLSLSGHISYYMTSGTSASNYDVEPGNGYLVGITLNYKTKDFSIYSSIDYQASNIKTTLFDQQRKDLQFGLGLKKYLFTEESK